MDLFSKSFKELTADFINGKIKADEIPAKLVIQVQRRLYAVKNLKKMKELSEACTARLNRKGLVYLEGFGWAKQEMIPFMGLVKKNDRWLIGDVTKFRNFVSSAKPS
jgi:hypothetical protein